jgi:hypothetical protein
MNITFSAWFAIIIARVCNFVEQENNGPMQKSGFKLIIFLLLIVVLVNGVTSHEVSLAQRAIDPRFGAIESFWAPEEAADLGVGWERILFYWSEIQPTGPGDWNTLHVLEEWLTEANAQGRTIVGLLKNTPAWATDGTPFSGVPRGLYLPVNDPSNLWATYVRRAATYYSPLGVRNWSIWNEPDIAPDVYGHEFSGSAQDYYQLVKVAYQVMKQVDPNATIHLGGMTYWHEPGYLRRYLQIATADPTAAENNYYFDVITYHIYFRPETIYNIVGGAFSTQQELGIPLKPIWVNETNARPSMDPEWPVQVHSFQIDLEQQAWYIVQAYAVGFHSGAARMGVYTLVDINMAQGDESWGLIRPYDFSKRPAYYAYQTTIQYLSGFTLPVRREQGDNYFIFTFSRPEETTRLMWARHQTAVTLQIPALSDSALLVTALGESRRITPENGSYTINLDGARCYGDCYMGGPPLFLVEEGTVAAPLPVAVPSLSSPTPEGTSLTPIVISPTITVTATSIATATTAVPTNTATANPPTATPTQRPTSTSTPTSSPTVVTTEVALVQQPAVPPPPPLVLSPPESAGTSWWLIAAGDTLGGLLLIHAWKRL